LEQIPCRYYGLAAWYSVKYTAVKKPAFTFCYAAMGKGFWLETADLTPLYEFVNIQDSE
jgi:hypothetical protein